LAASWTVGQFTSAEQAAFPPTFHSQDVLPPDSTAQPRVMWMRACAVEFRMSAPWVRVRPGVHRAQQRALHFERSGVEPQRARWKILLLFALLLNANNNNIVPTQHMYVLLD